MGLCDLVHYVCIWAVAITAIVLAIIAIVRTNDDSSSDPIKLNPISSGSFNVEMPSKDRMINPYIYNLGFRSFRGRDNIETIVFFHPISMDAREFQASICCVVIATCAIWKTTEDYVVDPSNNDGLSANFVTQSILSATTQYNDAIPFNVFGNLVVDSFGNIDTSTPDGKNEIFFGTIQNPNIIAAAFVHGVFNGPTENRIIIESDIILNDNSPNFVWGNASVDSSKMDLQNIITHELGHYIGLDHPPTIPQCSDSTLYPTASIGETQKRSLSNDDIQCIQSLYSPECQTLTSDSSSSNIMKISYIVILYILLLI